MTSDYGRLLEIALALAAVAFLLVILMIVFL